jgi:hypothetical protein
MPFTIITGDSFTSAGVGVSIPIPSSADYFVATNMTQMPLAPATPVVIRSEWCGPKYGVGASAANDGVRWKKSANTNVINIDTFATSTASNGFTYVSSAPVVEAQAANAITAITAASPAVVSQTNTYSEGDIVRIYNTTGMLQIAGMPFQISTVSGSAYTLIGLRAVGFATAATAGNTRRISKLNAVEPEFLYVTEITKATQAVVRTSIDPSAVYVVGMKLRFSIPQSFGMLEMNGLTGTITAVSAANYTVTVDIDSTAFSTFAFPASASSPTDQLFATVAPAGVKTAFNPVTLVQTGYDFQKQPFHTGQFTPYLFLAGGAQSPAGAASDVINWRCFKFEN